ncbi:glycosyl hydrolase [Maioricimonas sp. JC845]|uniref:glycosyl hydrolase n=1 Tax=Maioricimonas sp. JC845 TaxID=3232138 RepID=UPI00345A871D
MNATSRYFNNTSRPYVRWWWLAGPYRRHDIVTQLDWVQAHGFGGVEVAWVWPVWTVAALRLDPEPEWLSPDWSDLVAFTKTSAERLGLGCDFTFGTSWPFGGSHVEPEHRMQTLTGRSGKRVHMSWEGASGDGLYVLDHLNHEAFEAYAETLMPAFERALQGTPSALFCDSFELERDGIWSQHLWKTFRARFGYSLQPFAFTLHDSPDVRYDYRKLVSETFIREFLEPFTETCHRHNAISRVQCHGALTDLLAAYATVDIPESEALLFEPPFSRIPASAATLADRPVVSAETFTCIYGFHVSPVPARHQHWRKEHVGDLKLLADALFANGVNQIIWHGMPYQTPMEPAEFYAQTHVGPDSEFVDELPAFNAYLDRVSGIMKLGRTYTNLAVYLPIEDRWMAGDIPREERTPAAVARWEMRDVVPPDELAGFHPIWVSSAFLKTAECIDGKLAIGEQRFAGLYIDCQWLDFEALIELLRLADAGVRIVLKGTPEEPGHRKHPEYPMCLSELKQYPGTVPQFDTNDWTPLVQGALLPPYWARETDEGLCIFFGHPATAQVTYPMWQHQHLLAGKERTSITIHYAGRALDVQLRFEPNQSLLVRCSRKGTFDIADLSVAGSVE